MTTMRFTFRNNFSAHIVFYLSHIEVRQYWNGICAWHISFNLIQIDLNQSLYAFMCIKIMVKVGSSEHNKPSPDLKLYRNYFSLKFYPKFVVKNNCIYTRKCIYSCICNIMFELINCEC
jgi:hypothetical protein